jgi:tRNA nucleotidyltransferase (CCA-adding enzyme)
MALTLSLPSLFILSILKKNNFDAYIVGGAVRDLLLQQLNSNQEEFDTDYDFTTNAKPEEIQALFPESFYENTFGTVSVTYEDVLMQMGKSDLKELMTSSKEVSSEPKIIDLQEATKLHSSLTPPETSVTATTHHQINYPHFQITTYRSDEAYDDHRRPSSMNWGSSLTEDVDRRDFTINAMAIDVSLEVLEKHLTHADSPNVTLDDEAYTIIDLHQGQQDLQQHLIKTVGNPDTRFTEDALRMLRAIRFAVQLNFSIDEDTFAGITRHAELIQHISFERIRDELLKMLNSDYPAEAIELLDDAGLLQYILPELEATKGVEQGGHHTTDVWTHSLDALRSTPATDPIVRLATLLHDIAKPQTQAFQNNTITFYNHEVIGARVAKKIAERLRLSKHDCNRIFTLVRYHMFYYQPHNTDASIRRFMRKVGLENIDDILDLREGDRLGSGARKTSWRLEEMKSRMIEQLHQPFDVTDLAVNGNDLMAELQLQPGPILGQLLNALFEKVMDNPELNSRETLISEAKKFLERGLPTPSAKP